MKLELFDVDAFVSANRLARVTDLVFLEADGSPTRGGLFSNEIFGRPGSEERRERWAHIDLGGWFLHPLLYKACCQLDRGFPDALSGARAFRVAERGGPIEWCEGPDGPLSGVAGLMEAWGRIDWGGGRSGGPRAQRAGLLRGAPARLAFVRRWPVMPAAYRDVDAGPASARVREIAPVNYLYSAVMASAPSSQSGFVFADGARKLRAQEALLELHQSCLALVGKKHGIIQDRILGKYADYAVQGVISGPPLGKASGPGDQEVPFGSLGVPLYLAANLFQPFVLKSLGERLRAWAGAQERVGLGGRGSVDRYAELPPVARAQLNPDTYRRWLGRFMRSQADRRARLEVDAPGLGRVPVPLYDDYLGRPTTLADLLYVAVLGATAGKHVLYSRYPIEDFRSVQFARLSVLTTEETEARPLGGTEYPRYPLLFPERGEPRWVDSIRLNNAVTEGLGADYDGDRCRLFGLFTQEANEEAARILRSPANFVDGQGRASRTLKNEGVLTLYSLTA